MSKYVALLRGIGPLNPNMRNDKLRGVFESLGFTNVQTVISSGNVVFESPETDTKLLEKTIEEALPQQLGFHSTTIIRSYEQLRSLADRDPFHGYDHSRDTYLFVSFTKHKPTNFSPPMNDGAKILEVGDIAILSIIDMTATRTPDFMVQLEKKLDKAVTSRTWKTVERILKKFEG